jgi:hypothetical protein
MPSWCAEKSCSIKQEKISWLIKFLSLPLAGWGRVLLEPAWTALRCCMPKIWHKDDAPPAIYASLVLLLVFSLIIYKIHRSIKSYIICCKSWFARQPPPTRFYAVLFYGTVEGETALFVMGIFYYMRREPQGQPLSHCVARVLSPPSNKNATADYNQGAHKGKYENVISACLNFPKEQFKVK